jgi:murein lipoprotein
MKKFFVPAVLTLGLVALGGCATVSKEDFEAVKATANKAAADAAAAKSAADNAASAAAKAQASADAANACCRDTQTKIDRMFKKSMYK